MKRNLLLFTIAICISTFGNSQTPLYAGTHDAAEIYVIDTTGGIYTTTATISVTNDIGTPVDGIFGLSLHPITEEMYVLYRDNDELDRRLGTINLTSGVITDIGVLGNGTDICFVNSTLYATLGNPSNYEMVTVDITDASTTPYITGSGSFGYGHSLAWNYYNQTIFRPDDDFGTYYEIDYLNAGAITDLSPAMTPNGSDYWNSCVLKNDSIMLMSDGVELYEVNLNDLTFTQVWTSINDGHALAFGSYPLITIFNEKECSNEAMLSLNRTGTTYQWFKDGNAVNGETNAVMYPTHSGSPSTTNDYYCEVDGVASPTLTVRLIWAPEADLTATPTTVDLAVDPTGLVSFTNTSVGGNMYLWDFGTGGFYSTNQNPSFSYLTPGSYDVEFIVSKPNGCSDTAWVTINVINTASISELSTSMFDVYPNPVSEILSIDMNNGTDEYLVQLMDVSGRVIEERKISSASTVSFDMTKNLSGIYVVQISNNSEKHFIKVLKK